MIAERRLDASATKRVQLSKRQSSTVNLLFRMNHWFAGGYQRRYSAPSVARSEHSVKQIGYQFSLPLRILARCTIIRREDDEHGNGASRGA
jgi:hypothetical protein